MARLRYVSDQHPGIRRLKSGKGFRYVGANGQAIRRKDILARIRALAIPPAWTDVFINPAAVAMGPDGDREKCLPPLGVKLSSTIPADPGLAPGLYLGSLGQAADAAAVGAGDPIRRHRRRDRDARGTRAGRVAPER